MLAQAVTDRIDPHAGSLVRVLVKLMANVDPWMPQSQSLHKTNIREEVRQLYPNTNLSTFLDDYLQVVSK